MDLSKHKPKALFRATAIHFLPWKRVRITRRCLTPNYEHKRGIYAEFNGSMNVKNR